HQGCAFAQTLAQVGNLGAAGGALALHLDLVNPWGMEREDALHAFAVADATDGEHLVQPMPAPPNHHAGENLDALFVAFHDFGVDADAVAHPEAGVVLAILLRFNLIE